MIHLNGHFILTEWHYNLEVKFKINRNDCEINGRRQFFAGRNSNLNGHRRGHRITFEQSYNINRNLQQGLQANVCRIPSTSDSRRSTITEHRLDATMRPMQEKRSVN